MSEEISSALRRISSSTSDSQHAYVFYEEVIVTDVVRRTQEFPGAAAYGKALPEFRIQTASDFGPARRGDGDHIVLISESCAVVDAL